MATTKDKAAKAAQRNERILATTDPLSDAIAEIRKMDAEAIKLGLDSYSKVDALSTGMLSLDSMLGCGGLPRGRIVEAYGNESSGKTTLCLHCIASCQKAGGTAAFIDVEHALDPTWATRLGVDMSKLVISQPSSGEQALSIVETLVRFGACDLIIVDSVAALVPESELNDNMQDEARIGAQARLMSKALRKLVGISSKSKTSVVFINQLREKIGGFSMFGTPEQTPGGRALKFYATIRMEISRKASVKSGDHSIGNNFKVKIVKNKVAPPFKSGEMTIYFGSPHQASNPNNPIPSYGIDVIESLLVGATELGVITLKGSHYYFGEVKIGVGNANAIMALRNDPDLAAQVMAAGADALMAIRTAPVENPVAETD